MKVTFVIFIISVCLFTSIVSCKKESTKAKLLKVNVKDKAELKRVPSGKIMLGTSNSQVNAMRAFLKKDLEIDLPKTWGDDFLQTEKKCAVPAFYMYKHPVTNTQFSLFVEQTSYITTAEKRGFGYVFSGEKHGEIKGANWRHPLGPNSSISHLSDHPVVQVSWADASAYAKWAGAQLPTEAQWERAARGDQGNLYPWGNAWEEGRTNIGLGKMPYCDPRDGYTFTNPVRAFPKGDSPFGVSEMAGNVWEWTRDWYSKDAYKTDVPQKGKERVVRGGSWFTHPIMCQTVVREKMNPNRYNNETSFRCVVIVK